MPGIAGFTIGPATATNAVPVAARMQRLMTHGDRYKHDDLFCDGRVCCTRSHIDVIQRAPQPLRTGQIYVWLDGEIYNRDVLEKSCEIKSSSDVEFLGKVFSSNQHMLVLPHIDGYYAAVVYDAGRRKVNLLGDRYGLKHLYWLRHANGIAWGSEVKVFCALPDFRPAIDTTSVEQFFSIGYLLEDRTWFEQAKLLPSGTLVTWDLERNTIQERRYWWWDSIKPLNEPYDEEQLARELGCLFREAVERRCAQHHLLGITLSGGLDSRAILAAMRPYGKDMRAVTFGKRGCLDGRIARRVASKIGVKHELLEISEDNWLAPRIAGVWQTDGQLDLMHMHGIEFHDKMSQWYRINMNGFAGDAILGGSWLKKREFARDVSNKSIVSRIIGCHADILERFDRYEGLQKPDFYMLQNRIRRFTYGGTKHWATVVEQRKPFYDNKLIDFVYSLPDRTRYRGHIYKTMLLRTFPDLYRNIPWQNTGVPIGWPQWTGRASQISRMLRAKGRSAVARIGFTVADPDSYTDYPIWLRSEPAKSFVDKVLCHNDCLCADYVSPHIVKQTWREHLAGRNHSSDICRYLTLEIWLQQIYERKYLSAVSWYQHQTVEL